ncbi:hypothetical protein ACTWQB_11835 [Piscibacillus sp. B03]|uniref:hypothetical protein n=1 Tax=Piscibacillus sp. B03 TaxID=3457430 RepID=UPI003FCC3332
MAKSKAEVKKEVKKEIRSNLRAMSILVISLILINFDISIAQYFNLGDNPRIKWTLDFGIFSSIIGIIFSVIHYFYVAKKLYIDINIVNKIEDINKITIQGDKTVVISLKLAIKGKFKDLASPVIIYFPDWLDFQTKPKPYIEVVESENKCLIHLNKLIANKDNIDLDKVINFDLMGNAEEEDTDLIEAQIISLGV